MPQNKELLTVNQIEEILERMSDNLRAMVGVAVYPGLRHTEIFQLEWKDICMDGRMIRIERQQALQSRHEKKATRPQSAWSPSATICTRCWRSTRTA